MLSSLFWWLTFQKRLSKKILNLLELCQSNQSCLVCSILSYTESMKGLGTKTLWISCRNFLVSYPNSSHQFSFFRQTLLYFEYYIKNLILESFYHLSYIHIWKKSNLLKMTCQIPSAMSLSSDAVHVLHLNILEGQFWILMAMMKSNDHVLYMNYYATCMNELWKGTLIVSSKTKSNLPALKLAMTWTLGHDGQIWNQFYLCSLQW